MVVVGGGVAGLTGAMALARARRSVLVIDDGRPRATRRPRHVHNYLGQEGIAPADLLARPNRAEVDGQGEDAVLLADVANPVSVRFPDALGFLRPVAWLSVFASLIVGAAAVRSPPVLQRDRAAADALARICGAPDPVDQRAGRGCPFSAKAGRSVPKPPSRVLCSPSSRRSPRTASPLQPSPSSSPATILASRSPRLLSARRRRRVRRGAGLAMLSPRVAKAQVSRQARGLCPAPI